MATSTPAHPFADLLNAARKVVFSRTLKTADWANTTIAAGDTTAEIDKLRQGGVGLWRSLMRPDLVSGTPPTTGSSSCATGDPAEPASRCAMRTAT
jgi:hypothetical protein